MWNENTEDLLWGDGQQKHETCNLRCSSIQGASRMHLRQPALQYRSKRNQVNQKEPALVWPLLWTYPHVETNSSRQFCTRRCDTLAVNCFEASSQCNPFRQVRKIDNSACRSAGNEGTCPNFMSDIRSHDDWAAELFNGRTGDLINCSDTMLLRHTFAPLL